MKLAGIFERLAYLRYFFSAGAWKWAVHRIDYMVMDHLEPSTKLKYGTRCVIHPSVSFRKAENVRIGNIVRIQNNCVLWASPNSIISIGDYSGLGPGTCIFSSNHQFKAGTNYVEQPWTEKSVTIGKNVWVGAGCTILPGVTIGDDSVVAAGSVVTRDLPAGSIVGGVPAKSLKRD